MSWKCFLDGAEKLVPDQFCRTKIACCFHVPTIFDHEGKLFLYANLRELIFAGGSEGLAENQNNR
jgi:hypothetical protein